MTRKSPAFQFYPQDYISDINTTAMTAEQEGHYLRLLCFCWIEGSVPSDLDELLLLLKPVNGETMAVLSRVINCFVERDGRLYHKRLQREKEKQKNYQNEKSEAGKKGAKARWGKDKSDDGTAIGLPLAKNASSSSSSSSSSTIKHIKKERVFFWFEEDWETYPRKDGNKKKAEACYLKAITSEAKRLALQQKMKDYVDSVDNPVYLKHAETFFRNWESLEVSEISKNKKAESSPAQQVSNGRGVWVDGVIENYQKKLVVHSATGHKRNYNAVPETLVDYPDEVHHLVKQVLYDFGYTDCVPVPHE